MGKSLLGKSKVKESSDVPMKRRRTALSGSDIKSFVLFKDAFGPDHTIEKNATLKMTEWESVKSKENIKTWLISYGAHFASLITKIKRNAEPALPVYPLLVNALLPVIQISSCMIEIPNVTSEGLTEEQAEEVAEAIVQQSRQNSLTNVEQATKENQVDTTNTEDVRQFMILIEETIKSKRFENKGRVELLIHDAKLPVGDDTAVVLVAKPTVTEDDDEGFFQTAACMVIGKVKYGVYTSHKAWKFLRMDPDPDTVSVSPYASSTAPPPKYIIRHTQFFDLMKTSYTQLDQQSVEVYAHLLEMFDVPHTTDLLASTAAASASLNTFGTTLTSLLTT